jgi:hypothetical protein
MTTLIKTIRKLERHRKVQVMVTSGTIMGSAGAHIWPGAEAIIIGVNLITTIIWIWAE